MVSILVCSVNPQLREQLKANIEATIGIPYELLWIDNRLDQKGICAVYNQLAVQAQYDIFCFVHEDVLFETKNWGKELLHTFLETGAGAVGIAGSKYKSAVFSGWFSGQKHFDCVQVLHRSGEKEKINFLKPNEGNSPEEVVCLDGVFICCTRQVWDAVRFDEDNLKGFHVYDIDFSLRAARICKLLVVYNITLVHLTEGGDFTDNWMETSITYHIRMQHLLPFYKGVQILPDSELRIAKATMDFLKNYSISFHKKLRWIKLQNLQQYPRLYYDISKFLFYKPFRLDYIHKFLR